MRRKISLFAVVLLTALAYCSKEVRKEKLTLSQQSWATIEDIPVLNFTPESTDRNKNVSKTGVTTLAKTSACGGSISGSRSGSGYAIYPLDTINASSMVEGSTISVFLDAGDTPNRFVIIDPLTGSYVAASPWLGGATYPGPWGTSLNQRFGTLTFTRGSGVYYHLRTEVQGNGSQPYFDNYSGSISCSSPASTIITYGGVPITYYSSTKLLRFNSGANLATVLDKLEADYETFNTNYENQFPAYTADQLDVQDSISNFNEWQTVEAFENSFSGFISKRKDLYTKETNWLNTTTDPTDATDPDNEDFSSNYFYNAVANLSNKLIVGTETYQYTLDGLNKNGIPAQDEDASGMALTGSSTSAFAIPGLCNYCDTCRNWQRKKAFSSIYTDDRNRQWQFKQVIAIRGIYPDHRGYVVGTIKARRKSGSKWKRKRADLWMQMIGTIYSNRCNTSGSFNSGVYVSSRPRNHMRKKYAALGNLFFRTKKLKITGAFQLTPQGNSNSFGEQLLLTW